VGCDVWPAAGRNAIGPAAGTPAGNASAQQLFQWQQPLCVRHLDQAQLQMKPLLLLITKIAVRAQHDLQMPRQIFFAEELGDASCSRPLVARNLQQFRNPRRPLLPSVRLRRTARLHAQNAPGCALQSLSGRPIGEPCAYRFRQWPA